MTSKSCFFFIELHIKDISILEKFSFFLVQAYTYYYSFFLEITKNNTTVIKPINYSFIKYFQSLYSNKNLTRQFTRKSCNYHNNNQNRKFKPVLYTSLVNGFSDGESTFAVSIYTDKTRKSG